MNWSQMTKEERKVQLREWRQWLKENSADRCLAKERGYSASCPSCPFSHMGCKYPTEHASIMKALAEAFNLDLMFDPDWEEAWRRRAGTDKQRVEMVKEAIAHVPPRYCKNCSKPEFSVKQKKCTRCHRTLHDVYVRLKDQSTILVRDGLRLITYVTQRDKPNE